MQGCAYDTPTTYVVIDGMDPGTCSIQSAGRFSERARPNSNRGLLAKVKGSCTDAGSSWITQNINGSIQHTLPAPWRVTCITGVREVRVWRDRGVACLQVAIALGTTPYEPSLSVRPCSY